MGSQSGRLSVVGSPVVAPSQGRFSERLKALMETSLESTHKCPGCGVATPDLRRYLTGHETCIKCTKFKSIVVGTRSTFGGGNERVHAVTIQA